MIVGSLLLILVAVGLLVAGVLSSSNVLIIASIVATVIAAVVLIFGVRQSANSADAEEDYVDPESDLEDTSSGYRGGSSGRRERTEAGTSRSSSSDPAAGREERLDANVATTERGTVITGDVSHGPIPSQGRDRIDSAPGYDTGGIDAAAATAESGMDDDPPDEPAAQTTSPSNAAQIAMLTTEVLVVDGRPRYHVTGCVHLLGRESEPLPVGEAVELGFTPCGICEPDSALLAEARRV